MSEDVSIILRPFDPETDEGFIYSSWRNGLYYHTGDRSKHDPDSGKFFRVATRKVREVLKGATVQIACLSDSPIVIVGYVVRTGPHLHWIYVKEDFRQRGIGRLLCDPSSLASVSPDITRIGVVLLQKYPLKIVEEQGESHG